MEKSRISKIKSMETRHYPPPTRDEKRIRKASVIRVIKPILCSSYKRERSLNIQQHLTSRHVKFPSAFVHKRSQILMLRSKPLLSWPRETLFFPSLHHFLTHSCLMFTEFSSASNWKQTSQCPASKRRTHFLWSKFFFFLVNVRMVLSRKIT